MKTITRGLLTFAAACLAVPAFSQTSAREYNLEIERQPLAAALTEFSKQTGLQIGYFPGTLSENTLIGPLSGRYTAEAAITQLLLPSGLSFERLNERTIAVTGPESTRSERRGFSTIEQKTDHRTVPSFVRLANVRLAEGPAAEEDDQQIRTAANAPESDDKKRVRGALEEVIVTAQKRQERLQDVPIAISVLSGDELDKSTTQGLTEILNTVPGVAATPTGTQNGTTLVVRGVNGGSLFGGSNTVGYYLDSVPFGFVRNGFVPDVDVYDLERVEVLRGPQGTLYGASSQNGVVRVLTHPADLTKLEVKGRASVSSTKEGTENYRGDVAVNVPIMEDKLAARVAFGYQDLGGWIDQPGKDNANEGRIKTGRVRLKYKPIERFSAEASAWFSRADIGAVHTSSDIDPYRRLNQYDFDEYEDVNNDVLGLKFAYDFENFSVAATTGYLDYKSQERVGAGYLPPTAFLITRFESEVFSEEIVFTSTSNRYWRWTAGAMYREGEDRLLQETPPNDVFNFFIDFGQSSESVAVYGDLTRLFADGRFELTGGLRYFRDKVGDTENQLTSGATLPLINRDDSFDEVSPRVVLTWHAADELMVYGSYSEGFRSGFNQWALITRIAPDFPSVKPDTIVNYEIGAKGSLWDGRIGFDVATFFVDWKDRIQGLLVDYNGIPITTYLNGKGASGVGVDLGISANIAAGFAVGGTLGWNDLTVDSDVFIGSTLVYARGDRMDGSPEYSGGLWASYAFPIGGSGYQGKLSASANYISKLEARGIITGPVERFDGDSMLSSRASFSLQTPENWATTLYVDNVSNEDGIVFRDPFSPDGQFRVRPRTIGVMFDFKYK